MKKETLTSQDAAKGKASFRLPKKEVPFRALWERIGWIQPQHGLLVIIGIDIGLTSIRTVSVARRSESEVELLDARYLAVSGEPLSKLAVELERILKGVSFENTRLNIAVSGASTLVRYITLPRMTEKELRSSMHFEAEKYIPYQISDVVLDFYLSGETQDERGKRLTKGILAVCKKDAVKLVADACQALGAPLAIVDAAPLAIINAFQFNYPEASLHVAALLHIGYNTSNLSILLKGEPVFTREISYGGADLTHALVKRLGLTPQEAEAKKNSFSWEKDTDLRTPIQESLKFLAQEVRLSFNYFENHVPGAEAPEKLYLSGSTSLLDNLGSVLQTELDTPAVRWDPTVQMTVGSNVKINDFEKMKAGMAIAVGLAIRSNAE